MSAPHAIIMAFMLNETDIQKYGEELLKAMHSRTAVPPLTGRVDGISIEDAYHISLHFLKRRQETAGEAVIGRKIGVTSEAVQSMLGVYEPDFGFLTDAMQFSEGEVPIGHLIQPRAEAEIAFLLKSDLPAKDVSVEDVLAATEGVMACFEIVDSRIEDWKIRIEDTVADNASCGTFVVSNHQVNPEPLDLAQCRVKVYKNGSFLSEGEGAAVQGSPLKSVAWLANRLGGFNMPLKAGEIILSGSLVPLEPIVPGDKMSMEIPELGTLNLSFTDQVP